MKKYGFTLAEVLLTLSIIGIIASLTVPTFVSNVQNSSNAARLASSVSTLENGFTTMLAKEDVDNLFETEAWINQDDRRRFAGSLGNFISITGYKDFNNANDITNYYGAGNGPFVMNANGSRNHTVDNQLAGYLVQSEGASSIHNHAVELKNGALVYILQNTEANPADKDNSETMVKQLGGSLYSLAADVWIDVNGADAPNTLGRDIFAFYLGENGKLYPLGGKDVSIFDQPYAASLAIWSNASSQRRCLDDNIAGGGYGCTARVIADGYKINY